MLPSPCSNELEDVWCLPGCHRYSVADVGCWLFVDVHSLTALAQAVRKSQFDAVFMMALACYLD